MPPFLLRSLGHAGSAFGFGLLIWTAMTIALLQLRGVSTTSLQQLQWLALLIGGVLVALGLIAPVIGRAAGPQTPATPRSIWATRKLWSTLLTVLLALGLVGALKGMPASDSRAALLATLALVLLLASLAAVVSAALARVAAVPAVAAWRQPLALPARLLIALAGGLTTLYLLMGLLFVSGNDDGAMSMTLALLGTAIAACLWLQWRDVDRGPGGGSLQTPARRRVLRLTTMALFALAPLVAWSLATLQLLPAQLLLLVTGLSLLAGTAMERQLFLTAVAPSQPPTRQVPAT